MKKFFSLILALLMLSVTAVADAAVAPSFSDVKTSRWSYEAIKYAVEKGYMNGIGDGKFDPAGSMTRGMVVTVLYRREGSPKVTFRNDFTDVKAGKYYSDAVIWAKDEGVVNGITETTFDPNGKITREQLATMLSRFSERCLVSVPERADLSGYPDSDQIHSYAKDALAWANEANLIKGMSDGTLSPRGNATREQFATILKRFDETFTLAYNEPVVKSHYTESEYPPVDNADVYVAVNGSDSNPGTFDEPIATFNRAVEKVREIKQTKQEGDIIVAIKAGNYGPLSVTLTAEDSGTPEQRIIYCKYGDGDVVFNNGIDLTADDFTELDARDRDLFRERGADSIRKTDVTALFEAGLDGNSLILFGDTGVCCPARFPNKYDDGTDDLLVGGESANDSQMLITHSLLKKKLSEYTERDFRSLKLYGYLMNGWEKTYLKAASYDPATGLLTMDGVRLRYPWNGADGSGVRMCVSGVSKELDRPGEYWLDEETGTVYVYSPGGNYHIPVGGDMIKMDGTDNVTFRGLTFRNTTGSFIKGDYCHGVTVDLCDFSVVSSTAGVLFEGCDVGRDLDLTVTRSSFSLAYGQSLKVYGTCQGQYRYSKHANVVFDNNIVTSSNLVYDFLNAVHLESCSDLRVTHNDFIHSSRGAVSFDLSYNVLVEYNNFDSVMENSEDGGVVYSYHNVDGWNLVVRRNFFNYVHPDGTGTYGYYVDDYTGGADIYENLFFNESCPVMIHNGRDNVVHDNCFINTDQYRGMVSVSHGFRYDIDDQGPEAALNHDITNQWRKVFTNIDNYPEYRAGVEKWCPGILNCHMDFDNMDDPNFYLNPVNTIKDNVYINEDGAKQEPFGSDSRYHAIYVTVEGSRGYTLDENPIFVNPTVGDYRIRDGAGFPDIEFEKIGRY